MEALVSASVGSWLRTGYRSSTFISSRAGSSTSSPPPPLFLRVYRAPEPLLGLIYGLNGVSNMPTGLTACSAINFNSRQSNRNFLRGRTIETTCRQGDGDLVRLKSTGFGNNLPGILTDKISRPVIGPEIWSLTKKTFTS